MVEDFSQILHLVSDKSPMTPMVAKPIPPVPRRRRQIRLSFSEIRPLVNLPDSLILPGFAAAVRSVSTRDLLYREIYRAC